MNNEVYVIYAKLPEQKRFYPIGGNNIVKNLIYAEMYFDKSKAELSAQSMRNLNPDITFEVRQNG